MKDLKDLEQKLLADLQSVRNTIKLLGGKKSQFNDISVALISRSQEGSDQQFKNLLKFSYRLLYHLFSDEILKSILAILDFLKNLF